MPESMVSRWSPLAYPENIGCFQTWALLLRRKHLPDGAAKVTRERKKWEGSSRQCNQTFSARKRKSGLEEQWRKHTHTHTPQFPRTFSGYRNGPRCIHLSSGGGCYQYIWPIFQLPFTTHSISIKISVYSHSLPSAIVSHFHPLHNTTRSLIITPVARFSPQYVQRKKVFFLILEQSWKD